MQTACGARSRREPGVNLLEAATSSGTTMMRVQGLSLDDGVIATTGTGPATSVIHARPGKGHRMNETDPEIPQTTETQGTAPWTPAGQPDPLRRGAYAVEGDVVERGTVETDTVQRDVLERDTVQRGTFPAAAGNFAEGEEALPEDDARERVLHRGSFASGGEEMPEENAERRVHERGGFAVGEETLPDEDAEARSHPGTFADSEPPA